MVPRVPALAQSESKAKFFERLGLSDQNDVDKRLYLMMKEEAVTGRKEMSDNPNALLPHLRNDSAIQPPYSNSQISETALHHEIMRIYEKARPETKVYYNLGHDTEGVAPENWVIRWMLWHVFRYRDSRNRNRRLPSPGDSRERSSDASGTCSSSADNGAVSSAGSRTPTAYWDPVRDS